MPPFKASSNSRSNVDIDAILNRASVDLARQQRLADSLLAGFIKNSQPKLNGNSSGHALSRALPRSAQINEAVTEEVVLEGREETCGLGGRPIASMSAGPKNKAHKTREVEELRRKLLGKNARSLVQEGRLAQHGGNNRGQVHGSRKLNAPGEYGSRMAVDGSNSSGDEEEGRSGWFKSKRPKTELRQLNEDKSYGVQETPESNQSDDCQFNFLVADAADGDANATHQKVPVSAESQPNFSKRPATYLDQVLMERARRKWKRKKK